MPVRDSPLPQAPAQGRVSRLHVDAVLVAGTALVIRLRNRHTPASTETDETVQSRCEVP